MRMSLGSRAAARRETTVEFIARMAARTAPPKPWGRILSVDKIEKTRADERAALNLDQFTQAEQIALVSASSSIRHQAIGHRLRRDATMFTPAAFDRLRQRGLVRKRDDLKLHVLTDAGMKYAEAIADLLVEKHDLHVAWIGSHKAATAVVHCTCKWSCGIRYGQFTQANAMREHSRHLREIGKA